MKRASLRKRCGEATASAAKTAAARLLRVQLANSALELFPDDATVWNSLGVARYRAGDWKAAIEALEKSREFDHGGSSFDYFFLAMAHWQLGIQQQALQWFDRGVKWMEKKGRDNEELQRFHAEAAELLGLEPEAGADGKEAPRDPA